MANFTTFSAHARVRVDERLSMPEEDIALLLDHGLAVKISEEKKTNRVHLLFYSAEDFQCFVAIYDHQTKTVITLLPVDYYELLNHKIAPVFVEEAKLKVSTDYDPVTDNKTASHAPPTPPKSPRGSIQPKAPRVSKEATVFRLSASYQLIDGGRKIQKLGTWPRNMGQRAWDLFESSAFLSEIKARIAKSAPESSALPLFAIIRQGNKGPATVLPYDRLSSTTKRDAVETASA